MRNFLRRSPPPQVPPALTEPPPELAHGQRLGQKFYAVIKKEGAGVFTACFAAQVILTHCKETMGAERAQAWNEFIEDLVRTLRFQ